MSVAEVNKPQPPDLELAKKAAGGDGAAFEELYRRHYRRVYALTLRMMGNRVGQFTIPVIAGLLAAAAGAASIFFILGVTLAASAAAAQRRGRP